MNGQMGRVALGERAPGTNRIQAYVSPRTDLGSAAKVFVHALARNLCSVVNPIGSHYTSYHCMGNGAYFVNAS
jgi:hypothetical protein